MQQVNEKVKRTRRTAKITRNKTIGLRITPKQYDKIMLAVEKSGVILPEWLDSIVRKELNLTESQWGKL